MYNRKPPHPDLVREQERLERSMATLGVDKYRDKKEEHERIGHATDIRGWLTPLNVAVDTLSVAIEEFMKIATTGKAGKGHRVARFLKGMESNILAFATLKLVLDGIIREQRLTALASKIGRHVCMEKNLSLNIGEEERKVAFKYHKKIGTGHRSLAEVQRFAKRMGYKQSPQWEYWQDTDTVVVGLKLIELMCQSTGLMEVKPQRQHKKTIHTLIPTQRFSRWLEQLHGQYELLFPEYLPCVIAPKDWDSPQNGGYHTDYFAYPLNLVKTRSKEHQKRLREADLTPVYQSVNVLQRTSWQVNATVLDTALYFMDLGVGTAGLPSAVVPYPEKPHDIDTNAPARKAWAKQAGEIFRLNRSTKMQRLQAWKTLKIAQEFRRYDKIYFPYQLDFRGRIYSVVSHLTPQGTDLAKGLLHFGQADPVDTKQARDWLAIHGANCFGLDKVSFETRLQWIKDNEQKIIEIACDPLDNREWVDADSPFCYLAFCLEWRELLRCEAKGEVFYSRLPIAMDGSCNGLQHYAAMLRDPVAGQSVNLTPNDTPQDIYGDVAQRVNEKLRKAAATFDAENSHLQVWAQKWLEFGIGRKITKRPVMIVPYGGSYSACRDYVKEAVNEQGGAPFELEEARLAITWLTKLVWTSIGEVVVSARLAMRWLKGVAEGQEDFISWTTPIGFPVIQTYCELQTRRINTVLFGQRYQPVWSTAVPDKADMIRQRAGFAPNFVHSLDACVLMMSLNKAAAAGLNHFAMIHDSYATTAKHTAKLAELLREAFIALYQEHDVLAQFTSKELPPHIGGLDLDALRHSKYFFA